MLNRKTVKVTFENGDSLITDINGTKEVIRDYYLNNSFNVGGMTKGKTVEFLEDRHGYEM